MGYTNYWKQYRDFTGAEWLMIKDQYSYLRDTCEHHIFIDETKHDAEIAFNGTKNNDCETFILEQTPFANAIHNGKWDTQANRYYRFNFCKTRQNPYDLVVWNLLSWIANKFGHSVMTISRDRHDMTKLDVIDDPIKAIYESSISSPSS
mgnify:CR=1 FL=1